MSALFTKSLVGVLVIFSSMTLFKSAYAANSSCDLIKGKTYISFREGKFNNYANSAHGERVTFDANALGNFRKLYSIQPKVAGEESGPVSCTSTSPSQGVLTFSGPGIVKGDLKFWVYDNGARLWVVHTIAGRETPGWYLQLPSSPQNPPR
jgi:hypothetical protein